MEMWSWRPINYTKTVQRTDTGYHTVVQFEDNSSLPKQGDTVIATIEVWNAQKNSVERQVVVMDLSDNYWEKIYNICAWIPGRDISSSLQPYQGVCGYSIADEQIYYDKVYQNKKRERPVYEEDSNKEVHDAFNSFYRQKLMNDTIDELKNEIKTLRQQLNDKKEK